MRNKINSFFQVLFLFLIPFAFSIGFAFTHLYFFGFLALTCAIIFSLFLPICRGHENLFAFTTSTISLMPLIIVAAKRFLYKFMYLEVFDSAYSLSYFLLLFFIFLSIEQIVIGLIIRLIRPHQEELDFEDNDEYV